MASPARPSAVVTQTARPGLLRRLPQVLWQRLGWPVASPLAASAVGLVLIQLIVVVVWGADTGSAAGPDDALRVGADLWLLAHGAVLHLPDGSVDLFPLGLGLLPALAALTTAHRRAAGARPERVSPPAGTVRPRGPRPSRLPRAGRPGGAVPWKAVLRHVAVVAGSQTVFVLLVALAVSSPAARPDLAALAPRAAGITAAGAALGALAGYGALRDAWRSLPIAVRVPTAAALTAFGTLIATSAFGVALVLAATLPEIAAAERALGAGAVGGVALLALQLAVLPNLVIWALCYAVGTGFATGGGTVRPAAVTTAEIPDLPVFAALPPGPLPRPGWLVLTLLPVVAGTMLALSVRRSAVRTPRRGRLVAVLLASALCGLLVALAAHLSAGRVGGPATFGPVGWTSGLAAAAELAAVAVAVTCLLEIFGRRPDQPAATSLRTASLKRRLHSASSSSEVASRRHS